MENKNVVVSNSARKIHAALLRNFADSLDPEGAAQPETSHGASIAADAPAGYATGKASKTKKKPAPPKRPENNQKRETRR